MSKSINFSLKKRLKNLKILFNVSFRKNSDQKWRDLFGFFSDSSFADSVSNPFYWLLKPSVPLLENVHSHHYKNLSNRMNTFPSFLEYKFFNKMRHANFPIDIYIPFIRPVTRFCNLHVFLPECKIAKYAGT